MTSKGPFQPKAFYDTMKRWKKDTFISKSPCRLLTGHSSGFCEVWVKAHPYP